MIIIPRVSTWRVEKPNLWQTSFVYRGEPWKIFSGGARLYFTYRDNAIQLVRSLPPGKEEKGINLSSLRTEIELGQAKLVITIDNRDRVSLTASGEEVIVSRQLDLHGILADRLSPFERLIISYNFRYLRSDNFFAFCWRESVRPLDNGGGRRGLNVYVNPETGQLYAASNKPLDHASHFLLEQDYDSGLIDQMTPISFDHNLNPSPAEPATKILQDTLAIFNLTIAYRFSSSWTERFRQNVQVLRFPLR